jgi:hypothetical protein
LTLVLAGLTGPLGAFAQSDQPPPATSPSQSSAPSASPAPSKARPSSAQSEAGEPRAATSADSPAAPAEAPAAAGAPAAAPPAAGTSARQAARASGASASGHAASGSAQGGKTAAADRLELGTATVTGDREQPKVMYIVPWKKSDIGDLSGKPMNSLLDEALAPVDRDEFKRQVMYYQVVQADASQNGASKAPATQGEK